MKEMREYDLCASVMVDSDEVKVSSILNTWDLSYSRQHVLKPQRSEGGRGSVSLRPALSNPQLVQPHQVRVGFEKGLGEPTRPLRNMHYWIPT